MRCPGPMMAEPCTRSRNRDWENFPGASKVANSERDQISGSPALRSWGAVMSPLSAYRSSQQPLVPDETLFILTPKSKVYDYFKVLYGNIDWETDQTHLPGYYTAFAGRSHPVKRVSKGGHLGHQTETDIESYPLRFLEGAVVG